jgi:hypothetical protein
MPLAHSLRRTLGLVGLGLVSSAALVACRSRAPAIRPTHEPAASDAAIVDAGPEVQAVAPPPTHVDLDTRFFHVDGDHAWGSFALRPTAFPLIAADGTRVLVFEQAGGASSLRGGSGAPTLVTIRVADETELARTPVPALAPPADTKGDLARSRQWLALELDRLRAIEDAWVREGWTSMTACEDFSYPHHEPYACSVWPSRTPPDGTQQFVCGVGPRLLSIDYADGQRLRLHSPSGALSLSRTDWHLRSSVPTLEGLGEGCFVGFWADAAHGVVVGALHLDLIERGALKSPVPHIAYPEGHEGKWVIVKHGLGAFTRAPAWVPTAPTCAPGMKAIPEGDVIDRSAPHPGRRFVPAFCLDATEVPVSAYKRCVAAGGCPPFADSLRSDNETSERCTASDPAKASHPMTCVTRLHAAAYCAWVGKRLPSKLELDRAAFGDDARAHPWGDDAEHAGVCGEGTCPVGTSKGDVSPFGVLDLDGNAREWTSTSAYGDRASSWALRDEAWSSDSRMGIRCAR